MVIGVKSPEECSGLRPNTAISQIRHKIGQDDTVRWYGDVIVVKLGLCGTTYIDFPPSDICFPRTYLALQSYD